MKQSMIKGRKSIVAAREKDTVDYKVSLADYHPHHDSHLCTLVAARNMKTAGKLAKDARYICFLCGRAAKKKENLCEPVELDG